VGGFTLLEIIITVVVAGLLLTIALPSFQDAIRKSRRSEGISALSAVQQAQERWRSNNSQYTLNLGDLSLPASSPSGYYTISLSAAPASAPLTSAYVATAQGATGTSQAQDTACRKLSVLVDGGHLKYAGGSGTLSYAETHPCFAK
jgi:type IV pilus assembly protein PilE